MPLIDQTLPFTQPSPTWRRRWWTVLRATIVAYGRDHCASFAAAIAYFAFLAIFPLLVVAVAVAGYVLQGDSAAQERVIEAVLDNLPLSASSGRAQLEGVMQAVVAGRGSLGLVGVGGAIYAGSALFGALRTGLTAVFRAGKGRPWVQAKLVDLAMVAALGLLVLLSLALTAAATVAQQYGGELFGSRFSALSELALSLGYLVAPALISFGVFLVLYKAVPDSDLTVGQAAVGAALATVAFEALKIGFARFVTNFGNYDAVYGTLGFVVVFLLFAYLGGQITLFGAEFARASAAWSAGLLPLSEPAAPQPLARRLARLLKRLFVSVERDPAASPADPSSAEAPAPRPRGP